MTRATRLAPAVLSVATAVRISRRVAVIGGGSGGVVAARYLKKAGHTPVLFEAGPGFGGVWADEPTNDVVYKNLQTNLPTCVMQSPDLDFEAGVPSYVSKEQLGQYIEQYAKAFGVAAVARFGAKVTDVTPVDAGCWRVQWTSGGAAHDDTFDAVVVANGHYEEPYAPRIPGEAEWRRADASRAITHSRHYDDPAEFRGRAVLVVGGRSSGVDIARMLQGVAAHTYVLEKKCARPVTHEAQGVTHVPLGTRLCADGRLRIGAECAAEAADAAEAGEAVAGPPVERVVLATGYVYSFPFLDEARVGMRFRGERFVTPLYQHLLHAARPTLGFIGVPLAVPCPIPYFECQAAFLAEHLARPDGEMTTSAEREQWLRQRMEAVGFDAGRPQDLHFTSAGGGSPWGYMRELLRAVHAVAPPTAGGQSWLERPEWEARLATVEDVYSDRGARYPKLPWEDDAYRRCEYSVDWASGRWSVDDTKAKRPRAEECAAGVA